LPDTKWFNKLNSYFTGLEKSNILSATIAKSDTKDF